MKIPISIVLPKIWPNTFFKDEWNTVNFIVGANGTGKTMFSNELKAQLQKQGYNVRLLSAERLSGFEKTNYSYFTSSQMNSGLNLSHFNDYKLYGKEYGLSSSAFIILKERLDIRIKIEALLSDIFNKTIRLVEEGGYLKPKMQDINGGEEYGLKEQECHGLKEIISLLTFLYDDNNECLILDEPELHLHPQFQSFFLNELRKVAGNPREIKGKKLFFIITHSPYFLDIRSIEDIKNILVCHNHEMPTYIPEDFLGEQDLYILKKFLPRFNTHHKQFFFSPNPVFVEGYTDQQIISLLFEKIELNIAASGSSIIDVGGKDELAVFSKLCDALKIRSRIIADYDALFRGKLREVICANEQIKNSFNEKGFGFDVSNCIGELERLLIKISVVLNGKDSEDEDIKRIICKLRELYIDKKKNLDTIKDVTLLSVLRFKELLHKEIPDLKYDIETLISKYKQYIECIKSANIFILPFGELEHFFKSSKIEYLNITQKDKLFISERDFILGYEDSKEIQEIYSDILPLLKEAVPYVDVDILKHIKFTIIEWIQKVQNAIVRKEVTDILTLKKNARIEYEKYNQVLEIKDEDFILNSDGTFSCALYIKNSIIGEEKKVIFTDTTTPQKFKLD